MKTNSLVKRIMFLFRIVNQFHSLSCVSSIYFAILDSLLLFCVVLCVRLIAANDALINQELVCTKFDCLLLKSSVVDEQLFMAPDTQESPTYKKNPKKNQKISVWWGRNEILSFFLTLFQ